MEHGLEIELKKGDYFRYGEHYYAIFNYGNEEQKRKIYGLFQVLIQVYGSLSRRAYEGEEYIMPYFADENNNITTYNTGKIGGTSIPKDLLAEFIKRFVEFDQAIVKIGNEVIKNGFNYEEFYQFLEQIDGNKYVL